MLRRVTATVYVTPLREGGSLPGLVEADDFGTYVAKFVGAGQGRKALVAEIISGELARRLGLAVPELVLLDLDAGIARLEPDQEVQDLLRASGGLNLGVDFLPGSIGYDPIVNEVPAALASSVVWFDAFVGNVDRSWRNPNVLVWHARVWLIDHGATLIFHHDWPRSASAIVRRADLHEHVMARYATDVTHAHEELSPMVTSTLLHEVVDLVPDEWLADEPGFDGAQAVRNAYVELLMQRLESTAWLPEPAR